MAVGRFLAMVGVLVWRRNDGKCLLLLRSSTRDYAPGLWECASGRLEQGESFVQAVRREAREELGQDVRIECLLGTAHFYRGEALPENEVVSVHFGCSIQDPSGLQLSDKHSEYRWATLAEAKAMFSPGDWMSALIGRAEAVRNLDLPNELTQSYWKGEFDF